MWRFDELRKSVQDGFQEFATEAVKESKTVADEAAKHAETTAKRLEEVSKTDLVALAEAKAQDISRKATAILKESGKPKDPPVAAVL